MKKQIALLLIGVIVFLLAACGGNQSAATTEAQPPETSKEEIAEAEGESEDEIETKAPEAVKIYAFIAASLKNVMAEIADEYKAIAPNVDIIYQADSSGTLQTQIEEGAECDLFFSAAAKQMNALEAGGYTIEDSVIELLENKVVLIKPAGGETAVTSFDNITEAENIALAGPDVPVGQYAREIFASLGLTEGVEALEINEGINVTAVLTSVSEGSNEIGIVYATDAASMDGSVDIIAEAPVNSLETPVIYPAGLIKNPDASAAQTEAAQAFIEYLTTDEVKVIFEAYGFSVNQ